MSPAALRMLLRDHARLWWATATALAIFILLPANWSLLSRLLSAWDAGIALLIPLIALHMRQLDPGTLRTRYAREDPSAPLILLLVVIAALLSIAAIVMLSTGIKQLPPAERVARGTLAALTIAASWTLVPLMFTLHYADTFYSAPPERAPLGFPRTAEPVFWDFVYFSFTIAVACQTADVATHDAGIRRLVVIQSIISFVFNVSIVGFAINVTAGFLQGG